MSKIICDICGTSYPETAEQCPICGTVRPVDIQGIIPDEEPTQPRSGYTYVKGGRFSKANVKKRNMEKNAASMPVVDYEEQEEDEPEKTNKGLIVTAIILLMAILAVMIYIGLRFFAGDVSNPESGLVETKPIESTAPDGTTETTELLIPCTGLSVNNYSASRIQLYAVGEFFKLDIRTEPSDTTDQLVFISNDETVATISDTGVVTAMGPGLTSIEIQCGDQSWETLVYCDIQEETTEPTTQPTTEPTTEPSEPMNQYTLDDIKLNVFQKNELDQYDMTMKVGDTWKIYIGNIPLEEMEFVVDNTDIAKMEGANVVGVGPGVTYLHAKYGDLEVVCKISVH